MIRAATLAALGILEFVVQKPKQVATVVSERIHDTTPIPDLTAVFKAKKPRTPRKKHVCLYSHEDIWGAFLVGLLLGGFLVYIIF